MKLSRAVSATRHTVVGNDIKYSRVVSFPKADTAQMKYDVRIAIDIHTTQKAQRRTS